MYRAQHALPLLALAVAPAGCASVAVQPPEIQDASIEAVVIDLRPEIPAVDMAKFGSDATMTTLDANCGAVTHTATRLPAGAKASTPGAGAGCWVAASVSHFGLSQCRCLAFATSHTSTPADEPAATSRPSADTASCGAAG